MMIKHHHLLIIKTLSTHCCPGSQCAVEVFLFFWSLVFGAAAYVDTVSGIKYDESAA